MRRLRWIIVGFFIGYTIGYRDGYKYGEMMTATRYIFRDIFGGNRGRL